MAAVKDLLIELEEKYSRMGDSQLLTLERSLPRGGFDYDVVVDVLRERGYFRAEENDLYAV